MDIINKLNKKGNVTMEDILYHGSKMIVSEPEIRKSRFTKDFSWGFYCTNRRKYQRLIVDTMNGNDWLSKMKEIYHSWICKYLDNDKKPIYWQPRSYIRECYLQQKIL